MTYFLTHTISWQVRNQPQSLLWQYAFQRQESFLSGDYARPIPRLQSPL